MSRLKPCGPVIPTTPLPPTTPMFNRSPLPASATAAGVAHGGGGGPTIIEISSDEEEDEDGGSSDDSVEIIGGGGGGGEKRKVPAAGKKNGKGPRAIKIKAERDESALTDAEAYEFEVGGLLRAAESEGYAVRDPQPAGLRVSLFEFQRSTLQVCVSVGLDWVGWVFVVVRWRRD